MKIPAILVALAFATVAAAANPPAEGVKIPNKNGEITFNHSKHKDVKCETCHGTPAGKVKLDKDSGHKLCQECHKANKDKGASIACKTCHSGPKS